LEEQGRPIIFIIIITTLLTMAALLVIIGGGVFAVAILLLQQQQAGATTIDTTPVAKHNKCTGDLITCTSGKKTSHHSTKDDSTPFNLPLPFP
jgi:hypothetical protein